MDLERFYEGNIDPAYLCGVRYVNRHVAMEIKHGEHMNHQSADS